MPPLAYRSTLAVLAVFLVFFRPEAWAENAREADQSWQTILQQANGPGIRFSSQDEALKAVNRHLAQQEAQLASFVKDYPADSRHFSAIIRLADVLAAEGRLKHDKVASASAGKLLDTIEKGADTPSLIKADAGFARVSLDMQDAAGHLDQAARGSLLTTVRQFDAAYPSDRRTGNLLTEVATLYDEEPGQKKALLEEALTRTKDDGARHRIQDDLKRISLLGQPVAMRLQPYGGGPIIDVTQRRGRVEVILFWASFSLPALNELAALQQVAAHFQGQPVDFLTISVDEDRGALANTMQLADLKWPTHYDGKGWGGELVRSLGINALPTVWVLDREGKLLTLNARGDEDQVIRRALEGP